MSKSAALKSKTHEFDPKNGVKRADRGELADLLSTAVADTYLLYVKTQGFHWNVVGPMFYGLHKLTEAQYEDMAEAIDDMAERIRAIGFAAPGSFAEFSKLSSIKEASIPLSAEEMIKQLVADNEELSRKLRKVVAEADKVEDVKTADMLTERIGVHEENTWMLEALIS